MAKKKKRPRIRRPKRITGTTPGHELEIEIQGFGIVAGPANEEHALRLELEQKILDWLVDNCPKYFGNENNTIPGTIAFDVAHNKAQFLPQKTQRFVMVKELRVDYRNRKHWKNWIHIKDDVDKSRPGKPA
jgi:hypothetical protein